MILQTDGLQNAFNMKLLLREIMCLLDWACVTSAVMWNVVCVRENGFYWDLIKRSSTIIPGSRPYWPNSVKLHIKLNQRLLKLQVNYFTVKHRGMEGH